MCENFVRTPFWPSDKGTSCTAPIESHCTTLPDTCIVQYQRTDAWDLQSPDPDGCVAGYLSGDCASGVQNCNEGMADCLDCPNTYIH